MKIAIIGAGITGLTAAYKLSNKNHEVTIFEKNSYAGGLAAGFKQKDWNWNLEFYYHHLFSSDRQAIQLIKELGLENKLFFKSPKSSIYFQNQISQFDSPFSLLLFPHLSIIDKIRTGIITLYLKSINNWQPLEKQTASEWLPRYFGKKSYEVLWEPLIKSKFGQYADQVSTAWFWARIKKRTTHLGYLSGGFQVLIDKLCQEIINNKGEIFFNQEIKNPDSLIGKFDKVIDTTSSPNLPIIGAIGLIFELNQSFLEDGTYWLNINEKDFPFVAVVEHTNFIDSKNYNGNTILYVGGYYPQNHRYFKMTKEQILKEFLPYLQRINQKFQKLSILHSQLSINLYAQPIIPINYSKIIPPHQTKNPNVYLANMQQIYPYDRGINYAVELGEKIANITFS